MKKRSLARTQYSCMYAAVDDALIVFRWMLSAAGGGATNLELLSAAAVAPLGLVLCWVLSAAGGGAVDPELLSAATAMPLGLVLHWMLSAAAAFRAGLPPFGLDCRLSGWT